MKNKWLTPRKETYLHIINIIILIVLCIAIYGNGKDLSCDKCEIHFDSITFAETLIDTEVRADNFSVKILDLYNYYQNNSNCLVQWNRIQGFIFNG